MPVEQLEPEVDLLGCDRERWSDPQSAAESRELDDVDVEAELEAARGDGAAVALGGDARVAIGHELDAQHPPLAAHVADRLVPSLQLLQTGAQPRAEPEPAARQLVGEHGPEHGTADRRGQWVRDVRGVGVRFSEPQRGICARAAAAGATWCSPSRGHVVAPVTLPDVSDVYALRLLLEPAAAVAAAGRLEPATVARLRSSVAAAVDVEDPASIDRFLDANRAVHVTVAAAAGNPRLAAIVERLLDDSERAIGNALRAGAAGRGMRVHDEHEALLDALALPDTGPRGS